MPNLIHLRKAEATTSTDEAAPHPRMGFVRFSLISGTGWLIDVGLTMVAVHAGSHPFWASIIGAATAVTFVYFVSLRRVFEVGGRVGARGFPHYVVWQVVAITAASVLVAVLASLLTPASQAVRESLGPGVSGDPLTLASGAAKALITPLTLLANYLFMKWLVQRLQRNA